MIKYVRGYFKDLIKSEAECFVNMTSCTGRFEKSMSSNFFKHFPEYNFWYIDKCKRRQIRIGEVYMYETNFTSQQPRYIASLVYKRNWHSMLWPQHAILSIRKFSNIIQLMQLKSVAMPAIGYKLDKKTWNKIKDAYNTLDINGAKIYIYSNLNL